MGLLAGFTFSTYPIFTRFAIPHYRTMTINLYTFLVASASSALFAGPAETVSMVATPAVLPVALIGGVLCAALPYYLYTKAMDTLDNGMVSILATVEPVIATAISVVYYREPIQLSALIGILFILAAVILLAVKERRQEKRSYGG